MPTTNHKPLIARIGLSNDSSILVGSYVHPELTPERTVGVTVGRGAGSVRVVLNMDEAEKVANAILNARDDTLAAEIIADPEPVPAAASTDVVFVSAPPTRDDARRSNRRYYEFAEALRARPGEWGQYPRQMQSTNSAATTAAKIARGVPNAFPITDAGRFDATSDGRTVYVRFLLGGEA